MPKPSKDIIDLNGQPMFQILSRSKELESEGKSILHFELGDPDFDTPGSVTEAAIKSLKDGNTHYQPSRGDIDLLEAVQMTTSVSRGFIPSKKQLTVTTGANAAIFYALKAICDPQDEVLIPNPYFPSYIAAIKLVGGQARYYSLNRSDCFIPQQEAILSSITSKTKVILINTPSNPTGAVFNKEKIKEIYDIAEKHDLYIISDEVYARMIYDNKTKFASPGSIDHCLERTIIINGFSKTFAMTGWRIGVVIAPKDIASKISLISESIVSCIPGFIQAGARQALLSPIAETKFMYDTYRKRQLALCKEFKMIPGFECKAPQGAMYIFPYIQNIASSSERFALHLLNTSGIACVPGKYFGSQGEGHLRFSCAGKDSDIQGINEKINSAISDYTN